MTIIYKDGNKIINNYNNRYITYLTKLGDCILYPYNPTVYTFQLSTKSAVNQGLAFLEDRQLSIRPAFSFNNLEYFSFVFCHELGHFWAYYLDGYTDYVPKRDEVFCDFFGFSMVQWLQDENILERSANMSIWSQFPLDFGSYKEKPFSYKFNSVVFDKFTKSEWSSYKKAMSRDLNTPWLLPLKLANIII